jgi:hypothetical protein
LGENFRANTNAPSGDSGESKSAGETYVFYLFLLGFAG